VGAFLLAGSEIRHMGHVTGSSKRGHKGS